jgi:hypothetical protein
MKPDINITHMKAQKRIRMIQANQGSEGCYMELLRQARQATDLIRNYSFMFSDPEKRIKKVMNTLRRLPQNQTWTIVQNRSAKIKEILKP